MKEIIESGGKIGKAQKTKELIFDTALSLFATKGYAVTTLRDIAKEAKVSLGLTYRYFGSKEELLLTLYDRLATECAEGLAKLPSGAIGARFAFAINDTLVRLLPHRDALGSLFAVGLSANSEMAVLGNKASGVRAKMWEVYRVVVIEAKDSPNEKQADQITTLLYSAHLLIIMFWLQDRSAEQEKTKELVAFACRILTRVRPFLGLPGVARPLAQITSIISPMFGPPGRAGL